MALTIGTSEAGGTFYTQGEAIATIFNETRPIDDTCAIKTSQASIDNANRLDAGEIEFGFMASNWVPRAVNGAPPFVRRIPLRMASPANAGPIFFVALETSSITTMAQLKGKRVTVGPRESGMTQHAQTILETLGIFFEDFTPLFLSFAEGANALVRGEADVQFQCPIPNRVMTELSQRANVRVVPYGPGEIDRVLARVPFYRPVIMKKGAFRGVSEDIRQLAVVNVLVTLDRVPDSTVYALTKTVIENAGALAERNPLFEGLGELYEALRTEGRDAVEIGGVPLHPGALRAYRDTGYLSEC